MKRSKRSHKNKPWLPKVSRPKRKPPRIRERVELEDGGSLTRAGRTIVLESDRDPAQHQALTEGLAREHAAVELKIQGHVDALAAAIPKYDPLELLQRAYFDFFGSATTARGEHEIGFDGVVDLRMLEYAQAVIVSLPPSSSKTALNDEGWGELRQHLSELYRLLMSLWPSTHSAARRLSADFKQSDADEELFRIPLLLEWLTVRGSRYNVHERERLEGMLGPQSALLVRLFGVDGTYIANAIDEIYVRLTKGIGEAFRILDEIHREASGIARCEVIVDETASEEQLAAALLERTGRRVEFHEAAARAFGITLFDITELLPEPLLRAISLHPGQNTDFFSPGDYRGWPLRTPPSRRQPVLCLDGRYYLFNPFSADNLYRAVELAVVGADTSVRQEWNRGQKQATERLPVEILCAMLPGATVYRDVEYPFVDANGRRWCECDAVIVIDGLLLAIEVKAGRTTDTSPFEATADHIKNVRDLLIAPAKQADRLVQYIMSTPEAVLYDASRREVGRVRRAGIDLAIRCAVTADSLAPVSGLFQHRSAATAGEKVQATWCVSLDDLYAYRDVLSGPTALRHFLTYRMRAFDMPELAPLDELDHLGAYLKTNAYVDWIREQETDLIALHGFRADLDQFFAAQWQGDQSIKAPMQPLPPVLRQIIEKLELASPPGYLRCGCALLDLDGHGRQAFANAILGARALIGPDQRSRIVASFGKNTPPIYVAVGTQEHLPRQYRRVHVDHALSQLIASGKSSGFLIEACLAWDGAVESADCEALNVDEISESEQNRLREVANQIAARRFERARQSGVKLRRNDPCPCGSGRKYKKCCLNRSR